uniref:Uncharacterized protein n=1 Tax=Nothobranchius kuhntae TaxID=321403 RepID=A0A1A8KV47_NOTKU
MMIRLGRLTPGYFRLLQRQMSGEVRVQPHCSIMEPVAMAMAALGTGVSVYSARRMARSETRANVCGGGGRFWSKEPGSFRNPKIQHENVARSGLFY